MIFRANFRKRISKSVLCLAAVLLLSLPLTASDCTTEITEQTRELEKRYEAEKTTTASEKEDPTESEKTGSYTAPELLWSPYKGAIAVEDGEIIVDESGLSKGYVGFSVKAQDQIVVQISKDDYKYTYYDFSYDAEPSTIPLTMGNGSYAYSVWEHREGTKYACIGKGEFEVELEDDFQPYLRPSDFVYYHEESEVIEKGEALAKNADTDLDVVKEVYDYVTKNIKYDIEKAEHPMSSIPAEPDETMETGYGICLDYAALAAALLRTQGIPTKMIYGDVGENDIYHAWNMFYTQETGWVTVGFQIKKRFSWYRLDLTFSASGAPAEYVGDGSNYRDLYTY